ncbi:MAG: ribonuclease PH [Candidatus Caenarcaniphilales bacterium]|nr:ribonuclease PH [Candidatus Caenarcaniphilales bacterium]
MNLRFDGRKQAELRPYKFDRHFIKNSDGSVLVRCGDTKVIVTANFEERVPPFLDKEKNGWLTAEYSMLPGSCLSRVKRDRATNSGRSQEISRLIGRALRAMLDLSKFPGFTIHVDADVIQADGGTRTASITGAYVAVYDCLQKMKKETNLFQDSLPIQNQIAAVSVGIKDQQILLDLNYEEDSIAQADANFVLTSDLEVVEIQGTAEQSPFKSEQFLQMLTFAQEGVKSLCESQNQALELHLVSR